MLNYAARQWQLHGGIIMNEFAFCHFPDIVAPLFVCVYSVSM